MERVARAGEPASPAHLVVSACGDDPSSYVLRDRDPSHFNESLRKQLTIESATGPIVLFSSDSTIAWELKSDLRSAVTGLAAEAVIGDLESARDSLYGWIDSVDLLTKSLDLHGALAELDRVGDRLGRAGAVSDHPDGQRVIRAAADVRTFLSSIDRDGVRGASLRRR